MTDSAPPGICAYCWRTWQAQPSKLLYCRHTRTVARKTSSGEWKVLKAVTDDELRALGVAP